MSDLKTDLFAIVTEKAEGFDHLDRDGLLKVANDLAAEVERLAAPRVLTLANHGLQPGRHVHRDGFGRPLITVDVPEDGQ